MGRCVACPLLVLVLLLSPHARADSWDPGDDDWLDDPSVLSVDCTPRTHGPHTLSSSDPRDSFKFRLTRGYTYRFTAAGGSGDTVADLSIMPEGGGGLLFVRASDDDSGEGNHFSITYTPEEPLAGGTAADWILVVETYSPGASATYTLEYERVGCGGDSGGGSSGGGGCSDPPAPHSPWPGDGATNVEPDFWTRLDWAPVAHSYDVYFGTSSSPGFLQSTNTSESDYWLDLRPDRTYYWRVVSKDGSCSTSGPIWSFRTGSESSSGGSNDGGTNGNGGSSGGGAGGGSTSDDDSAGNGSGDGGGAGMPCALPILLILAVTGIISRIAGGARCRAPATRLPGGAADRPS